MKKDHENEKTFVTYYVHCTSGQKLYTYGKKIWTYTYFLPKEIRPMTFKSKIYVHCVVFVSYECNSHESSGKFKLKASPKCTEPWKL